MTQEALKIALDALETELSIDWTNNDEFNASAEKMYEAIAAIKEALAQPEQSTGNILMDSYKAMQSMKVQKPLHVVCQCDKCKAESQEPVAWMYQEYRDDDQFNWRDEIQFVQPPNDPNYFRHIVPVYTHPPQRTWVGLTDEEIKKTAKKHRWHESNVAPHLMPVFRSLEAKLKDKNA
jgi:hypothetical protein